MRSSKRDQIQACNWLNWISPDQKLGHIFPYSGVLIEPKFMDGVSRAFFSLGILNDEVWSPGPFSPGAPESQWRDKSSFIKFNPGHVFKKHNNLEKKLLCYYIAFKYNQYLLPLQHWHKMKSSLRRSYIERISSWGDCTLRWLEKPGLPYSDEYFCKVYRTRPA